MNGIYNNFGRLVGYFKTMSEMNIEYGTVNQYKRMALDFVHELFRDENIWTEHALKYKRVTFWMDSDSYYLTYMEGFNFVFPKDQIKSVLACITDYTLHIDGFDLLMEELTKSEIRNMKVPKLIELYNRLKNQGVDDSNFEKELFNRIISGNIKKWEYYK